MRCERAAEQFLFEFLESLPETAGRFELNALLDFRFGPRPAEVDLLCREPRLGRVGRRLRAGAGRRTAHKSSS